MTNDRRNHTTARCYAARLIVSGLTIFALLALTAATAAALPGNLQVNGSELVLNGQGTRTELTVELYAVGLYLPQPMSEVESISQPDIPKAFVVKVVYDESAPDEIPEDWRETLLPALDAEQADSLRQAYSGLGEGDTVFIAYAPDTGTTVRVNDRTVLTDPGHELMGAFMDVWLGASPVSQELKQAMLR